MIKTYKLENLDCASCASKIERAVGKIKGVDFAAVNFLGQKLVVEAEEAKFAGLEGEILKACKKAEPDVKISL